MKSERKLHLDALRIAAMLMVMFNHSGERGFMRFGVVENPVVSLLMQAVSVVVMAAVPLFFMISGSLLLGREESLAHVLRFRFLRYLIVLVAASFVSYVYVCRTGWSGFSIPDFLENLYSGQIVTSYWFLYAYLGFLLGLPLLRRLAQAMRFEEFLYLSAVFMALRLLDLPGLFVYQEEIGLQGSFFTAFAEQSMYYPIAGYMLEKKAPDKWSGKKALSALFLAAFAAVCMTILILRRSYAGTGVWSSYYFSLLICPVALFLFAGAKACFARVQAGGRTARVITLVGGCTFGIYLFEGIYRDVTVRLFLAMDAVLPTYLACLIWIAAAFVLGLLVTLLLRRLPGVKRYI